MVRKYKILIFIAIIVIVALVLAVTDRQRENVVSDVASDAVSELPTEDMLLDEASQIVLADGTYEVAVEESTFGWRGKKILKTSAHTGTATISVGDFMVTEGVITAGSMTIDMTSIVEDGEDSGVVTHLKSADFFEVETYPEATFSVKSATNDSITGDLTIKDVTQEITLPVIYAVSEGMIEIGGTSSFDRTLWGVTFGSGSFFDNLGDNVIDDIIDIEFSVIGRLSVEEAETTETE